MKPLPLLLAATVIAHAALGYAFWRRTPPRPTLAAPTVVESRSRTTPAVGTEQARADAVAALKTAYAAGDARTVRDLLLAAGVPPSSVRQLVASLVWAKHQAELDALATKSSSPAVWWRDSSSTGDAVSADSTALDQLIETIQHEINTLMPDETAGSPTPDNPDLAFLPAGKQKRLAEINRDYDEMIGAIRTAASRFELPADRDKIAFLEAERDRDIAAALTPEEREQMELRTSDTAYALRDLMTGVKATEAEYRAIFELQKIRDANPGLINEEAFDEKVAGILGADRYRAYVRTQDHDYTNLQAAAERFAVPAATVDALFNARYTIADRTRQIAADTSLNDVQKLAALQAIARDTRAQVSNALGAEAAAAYLEDNMKWLADLETGNGIAAQPNGNLSLVPVVGGAPENGTPLAPREPIASH